MQTFAQVCATMDASKGLLRSLGFVQGGCAVDITRGGTWHALPANDNAVGPQTMRMLLGGLVHLRSSHPEWLLEVAPQLRSRRYQRRPICRGPSTRWDSSFAMWAPVHAYVANLMVGKHNSVLSIELECR